MTVMANDESGFTACAEEYAVKVGKTVDELKADGIWPVRCRCRPGTDNPHCGGFFMARGIMDTVDDGNGGTFQAYRSIPLTSAHEVTQ